MTVIDITADFDQIVIDLDETNRISAPKTPTKASAHPTSSFAPVSPYSDDDSSSSASSSSACSPSRRMPITPGSSSSNSGSGKKKVMPSAHKLAELSGRFLEEPLLKENPNRFVLFPIEDTEVSLYCCRHLNPMSILPSFVIPRHCSPTKILLSIAH